MKNYLETMSRESMVGLIIGTLIITFGIISLLAITDVYASSNASKDEQEIKVVYNYCQLEFKSGYPQMYNNRIYLPLRSTAEIFGYSLEWNGHNQTATLTNANKSQVVKFYSDSNLCYINGKKTIMKYSTLNIDGRLFIPVRFMAEILGLTIEYVPQEHKLYLYEPDIQP